MPAPQALTPRIPPTWQSVAVYPDYQQAQAAVDYLSDQRFPVENTSIVGSDLKSVERVLGRLNWGRAALGGVASGLYMGLFIGLLFAIFVPIGEGRWLWVISACMFWGALFGVIFGLMAYAFSGGKRDFTSVQAVVASRYEILVAPEVAGHAAQLLGTGGGGQAAPPMAPMAPPKAPPVAPPVH